MSARKTPRFRRLVSFSLSLLLLVGVSSPAWGEENDVKRCEFKDTILDEYGAKPICYIDSFCDYSFFGTDYRTDCRGIEHQLSRCNCSLDFTGYGKLDVRCQGKLNLSFVHSLRQSVNL